MTSLTTLCSLFLIISCGFFAKKFNLFSSSLTKELNKYLYYFSIPAITFISLIDSEKAEFSKYIEFILLNSLAIVLSYVLLFLTLRVLRFNYSRGGAILYASLTGSNIFFAFPIIIGLFTKEYLEYAVIYIVFVVTISDLTGFMLLSLFKRKLNTTNIKSIFKDQLKNPIVLASLVGLCFLILGINIPVFLHQSFQMVSDTTTGVALFSVGIYIASNLELKSIRGLEIIICSSYKLLIFPLIVLLTFTLLTGFEGVSVKISLLQASMPTAAFAATVGDIFDLDQEITAQSILFTSILFLLTSTLWLGVVT